MPELPEVETTRRGLEPHLLHAAIASVVVFRRDLRWPIPDDLEAQIARRRILALRRRAKYLLLDLDDGTTLLMHLGMSGSLTIHRDPAPGRRTHEHVWISLDDGSRLVFRDPRRFGAVLRYPTTTEENHPLLQHLGPEPLSDEFSQATLQPH